jgi:hypothetical protein
VTVHLKTDSQRSLSSKTITASLPGQNKRLFLPFLGFSNKLLFWASAYESKGSYLCISNC